ncbi:MAG: DUF4167 domain-containing protein [Silicimonas sp.]|nr:DUF4167 domain-containing protein [Silicimonas sp.]
MRSSKSRSRSKGNRNRSVGNIVNRVFDSSGPEGKVRGTPQQIIDKYNQLARDAQLGNDRVATENFQQHAEHYLRMLAEAQREQQERQQQNQQNPNQGGGDGGQNNQPNNQQNNQPNTGRSEDDSGDQQRGQDDNQRGGGGRGRNKPQNRRDQGDEPKAAADVIDTNDNADGGLVETPEDKPKRPRRARSKPPADEAPSEPQPTPDAAE